MGENYEFVDEIEDAPDYAPSFYGFALKGDKITAFFSKQSYVYQTHVDFAKEYPDMDKELAILRAKLPHVRGGWL